MVYHQAGLLLEEIVSKALTKLGVRHRRTEHNGLEDTCDQIDLIVYPDNGRAPLEIQLTLRLKNIPKLFSFALKALTTPVRGIRLYMEVVRNKQSLKITGATAARAIVFILNRFRNFGPYNLLGVRVHPSGTKIEKFDLVAICGKRLIELVRAWHKEHSNSHTEKMTEPKPILHSQNRWTKNPNSQLRNFHHSYFYRFWTRIGTHRRSSFIQRKFC
ncbi:MAG: hypothetical protein UT30_C0009G0053 [Candidatus Uhrbacteria bacterium GW2011_GWF2_39_13]|uniref:Uncharacterized protein n=1 Tax=Candidatus Uhrbacteria bacterium GW2011_GWF2_39_13 TaxID=1618995 RepID=A0A0G0MMI8_9BACT|nr:MAG: hypothetical protein UT30_C0009G0053 [Candidatus Uhrbacteria bacterium GW2011_GWF2_39_13]